MQAPRRSRRALVENRGARALSARFGRSGRQRAIPLAAHAIKSNEDFSRRKAQNARQFLGGVSIELKLLTAQPGSKMCCGKKTRAIVAE
jgi:hypothetical protein